MSTGVITRSDNKSYLFDLSEIGKDGIYNFSLYITGLDLEN